LAPNTSAASDSTEMSADTLRALTLAGSYTPPHEDWKRGIAEIIFGRMWLILSTTLTVFAGAVAIWLLAPPVYEASSTILIRVKPTPIAPQSLQEQQLRNDSLSKEDLTTELQLLSSPDVIRQVVGVAKDAKPTEEQIRQIDLIKSKLIGEVVPSSNVLAIRLRSADGAWAERTLDKLIDRYLYFRAKAFHPHGERSFLEQHAAKYRKELESIEGQLSDLRGATSVTLVDSEVATNLDLLQTLQRKINELEQEQTGKQKSIQPLEDAIKSKQSQYFAFLALDAIDRISAKLLNLKAERLALLRLYPEKHEKVRALDKVIQIADRDLRSEAGRVLQVRRLGLESLALQLQQMQKKVGALKKRNQQLQYAATRIQQLRRQAEILTSHYKTFAQRAEEASLNQAIASTSFSEDVTVLSRAQSSAVLIFPRTLPTLAIGLIVGLLLGLSLALLFESLDQTIKKPQDVARHLGLPVLLSVPKV